MPRYDAETGRQWATEILIGPPSGATRWYRGGPDLLAEADRLRGELVTVSWIPGPRGARLLRSLSAAPSRS
jgi:hypothetical protein